MPLTEDVAMKRTLPDYDDPPVVETALGVKFAPVQGWSVLHFGQLLLRYQDEYPRFQLKPPLGEVQIQINPQAEDFDFPIRCWFINSDDTQLLQIQNTCFIRNWRKTPATPGYQHYDVIKPLFERDWRTFCAFLNEQGLARPDVWECEVTYINHFVRGREWHDYHDLSTVFHVWAGLKPEGLFAKAETASFAVAFALPRAAGRLQFVCQPGVRKLDGAEVLQLSITASGRPGAPSDDDILAWLDIGHAAVVNGFTDFTTAEMHRLWRIK